MFQMLGAHCSSGGVFIALITLSYHRHIEKIKVVNATAMPFVVAKCSKLERKLNRFGSVVREFGTRIRSWTIKVSFFPGPHGNERLMIIVNSLCTSHTQVFWFENVCAEVHKIAIFIGYSNFCVSRMQTLLHSGIRILYRKLMPSPLERSLSSHAAFAINANEYEANEQVSSAK